MDTKAINVYKQSVVKSFDFLKSALNIQEALLRAIPVEKLGFLVPVCKAHEGDIELLEKLAEWRNDNAQIYSTQFNATLETTKSWLNDYLCTSRDRVLFLLVDNQGKVAGHVGFKNCDNSNFLFQIDHLVIGESAVEDMFFTTGMLVLMEWARKTINVGDFFVQVMDDNLDGINFYQNNGFVEERRIPLFKEENNHIVFYREAIKSEKPVKAFVRMIWRPVRDSIGKTLILTAGPSLSAREAVYSFDAASNGWNSSWSKYLTAFERRFAEYVGVKYALATSSCTGALQIALMSMDIGPGDEVIVPDQTWVATANAVRYVGAIPVFADVELDTWNIDSKSVESLITNNTKAIIPVHMYGHPARMTKIIEVANKYNLKIVEDAAPAIGAEWEGKRCGSFGDFAAFSFQGAKLMVTGEGGMLVTNSDALYQRALKIWDQGRNPTRTFWIDANGVKFKMSNIQAALGLGQLERVDELIEMKRRLFSWYQDGLSDVPFITLNKEVSGARSIYWMSSLFLDEAAPLDRDGLMKSLKLRNVDTRPVFPAISQYPIWPRQQQPQPTALRIGLRAINLPSGVCLTKDEVMYVAKQIRQILIA